MDFKLWLTQFEAYRPNRPTTQASQGFTFGGGDIGRKYGNTITADKKGGGLGLMGMDYRTRVSRGKGVEEKIKEALFKQHNIRITPPSAKEDMYDKIDGYWNKDPIQIKYRDSGSDILFELINPYNKDLPMNQQKPGKDTLSKAVYYVVLDNTGRMIYKIPIKILKALLLQTVRELGDGPLTQPFRASNGVQIRPVFDPATHQPKINAFVPVGILAGTSEKYPVNVQI